LDAAHSGNAISDLLLFRTKRMQKVRSMTNFAAVVAFIGDAAALHALQLFDQYVRLEGVTGLRQRAGARQFQC